MLFFSFLFSPQRFTKLFHYLLINVITKICKVWLCRPTSLSFYIGFVCLFFLCMKLILTGHCSLVANSPPDFPLPVKPAHGHKQNDRRESISTVKSWRIALLGQKWDDITDGFHCGSCTGTWVYQAADE